jgi:hypothetical protein
MMRSPIRVVALVAALLAPMAAQARPLYFQNLTTIYGLVPGDEIYACGVCHQRWEGTGGRNPYGTAVEQQLYLGKSIVDAILDIENEDTDGDGFLNGDELATQRTLPGYNCSNYGLAVNPPAWFQSIITPGVPTCLLPLDIEVTPATVPLVTQVGDPASATVDIINNGTDFALQVTSVQYLPGANPALGIVGPPFFPISIAPGQRETIQVTFSAPVSGLANGTLRVTSNDPDEPTVDVAVSAFAFIDPVTSGDVRGGCLKDMEKSLERLTKAHLREWGDCYLDELAGVACDTAKRDLRIGKAEAKLRSIIGGSRDRNCAAKSLSAPLLGLPAQCPAPCGSITQSTMSRIADCLVCQQAAATSAMLTATVGAAPPDLPLTTLGPNAQRCAQQLVIGVQNGIRAVQRAVGGCELSSVLSNTDVDCAAQLAPDLQREADKADAKLQRCTDTTGLEGCLFAPSPDPDCLGATAVQVGTTLAETVFPD